MKRRLTRTYDLMTMPDSCKQRIEQRLVQQIQAQEEGNYIKAVSPAADQRNHWTAAAAVVCLMLVLSVGGAMLFLRSSVTGMDRPTEASVRTEPPESAEDREEDVQLSYTQQEANALFAEILDGKRGFFREEYSQEVTVVQYSEERTKDGGKEVTIPCFTMVDMDRDGIKELVFQVRIADDPIEDYLILRYSDSADGKAFVYAYMEPRQKITDLKKDGSFYWRGSSSGMGEAWIALDGSNGQYFVNAPSKAEGVLAMWHVWPCKRADLVLKSYEFAGTGQTRLPSSSYYTFDLLIRGEAGNNWESHKEQLTRGGMICLEENGSIMVFDPDAPGCCLFGTLTNENGFLQFADLGFYISNEFGEREGRVLDFLAEKPKFIADSHLEELDAHGRELERPKELLEYLS